jgi:hypothetical protein
MEDDGDKYASASPGNLRGVDAEPSIDDIGIVSLNQAKLNGINAIRFKGNLVTFNLSAETDYSITIHDLSGKIVNTVASGHDVAGKHSVSFNKNTLAAGTYCVSLNTPKARNSQRMITVSNAR